MKMRLAKTIFDTGGLKMTEMQQLWTAYFELGWALWWEQFKVVGHSENN
jgi:hypothetical protein